MSILLMMCDIAVITFFFVAIFGCKRKINIFLFYLSYFVLSSYKIDFDFMNASDATIILANIMPLLISITLIYLFFKVRLIECVMATIFNIIIIGIIQAFSYIVVNIINDFIPMTSDTFANTVQIIYMFSFIILITHFKQKLSSLFTKVMIQINKITKQRNKQLRILSLTGIIVLISILTMISYRDGKGSLFDLTNVAFVLISIVILVSYYKSTIEKVKIQGREETERISNIHQDFVDSMNNFGHSYNNLMQTISFLVNCEELTLEDVRPVLKDIVQWSEENKINNKLRFINIPNVVIASVLSIKYSYAEELGVRLNVKYSGKKSVSINSKDFIDVLNIILDNAIEAAHYTDDKLVSINVDFDHNDYINIKIDNNFVIDENGKVLKYGKSKKIGLNTIDDIVKKTKNLKVDTIVNDSTYEVDVNIWEPDLL